MDKVMMPRILQYWRHHQQSAWWAIKQLMRAPLSYSPTIIVIALVLFLPLCFWILVHSAEMAFGGTVQQHQKVTLYLKNNPAPITNHALIQKIQHLPEIHSAHYISPEQGLKLLSQKLGLGQELMGMTPNPLPGVIEVLPVSSMTQEDFHALVLQLKKEPLVHAVYADVDWLARVYWLIALVVRLSWILSGLLGIGALFIVGNTIRLVMKEHGPEKEVLRLLGATEMSIRRPYLYLGMLLSSLGSLLACCLVHALNNQLREPVANLAQLYHVPLHMEPVSFIPYITLGACLGVLGARWA